MTTKALILIAMVALGLAIAAGLWLGISFAPPEDAKIRVQYLEQYVVVAQIILGGMFVALASVIVPMMLPEARDKFERYKESRQAYSRAKTAVLYLPDRVIAATGGGQQAFELVEQAHRELHFAETFGDMIIKKGYLNWFSNPGLWILYNYWQIIAVAEVLRSRTGDWSLPENKEKLRERLRDALEVVHGRFGKRGENCEGEKWELEDGSRFKEEDELEEKVIEAAHRPFAALTSREPEVTP